MRHLIFILLISLFPIHQALATDAAPGREVDTVIQALRDNNLGLLLELMSPEERAAAIAEYDRVRQTPGNPDEEMMVNMQLGMLTNPEMTDMLVAGMQAEASQLKPDQLAMQVGMGGMMAQGYLNNNPELAQSPELKLLFSQIPKIQAWLRQAGINDPEKADQFARTLITGFQALGITSAEQARQLTLPEVLERSSRFLGDTKKALTVYGIDIDGFLSSLVIQEIIGDGPIRTLPVSMTLFGEKHALNISMIEQEGVWIPKIIVDGQAAWFQFQNPTEFEEPPQGM